MSPEQIALVQASFERLPAEATAALLYGRLFELDPSLRSLFPVDLAEQGRQLMTVLGVAVRGLDDPDSLLPVVRELGRRHACYGVRPAHYRKVGVALLWALERSLGAAFTSEARRAWIAAYAALSGVMQDGAHSDAA